MVSIAFSFLFSFIYIFNKATDLKEDTVNISGLPIAAQHYRRVMIISLICFLLPLPFLFEWPNLLYLYLGLSVVGYLYSVPLRIIGLHQRLKDILFVKNAVSAASWGAIPALVPALYNDQTLSLSAFILWLNYFIFIFAVEVVWDIRDIDGDKASGVKTLPNVFGVWPAKIICLVPISIMFGWRLLHTTIPPVYLVAYILTIISIVVVRQNSHPYFFQNLVIIWIIAHGVFLLQYYV